MKVKLTKDFAWCFDGKVATRIPAGSEVESPIAENAVDAGCAAAPQKTRESAPLNETHAEAPINQAMKRAPRTKGR